MIEAEKSALLMRHEFFRDMPPSVIARFVAHARVMTFVKAERIFSMGDEGFGLLAVISGLVRISVPSESDTELTLNIIGANEIFGEIALLDGLPRSADATALSDCRLLLLERRDFLSTLMAEPSAALTLLKVVSSRLRRTSHRLAEASFGPMSSRLAQALLSVGKMADSSDGQKPHIRMSQREIGNLVGLSRESTNRYLRTWQRAGLVDLHPGGLSIQDWNALEKLAAD